MSPSAPFPRRPAAAEDGRKGQIRQRGLARLVLLRPRIGNADTAPPPGAPWHFDASADSLEAAVAWVDPKAR
jgi:hypothetical protein